MDSTERRRLNRLLRKPVPPSLAKSLGLRQKLSRNVPKQSKYSSVPTEKQPKQELNVDIASLCAEMCGISNISQSATIILQKHLNQIARLLIHEIIRVMEQSRRGTPQASDVDLASVLIGLESPFTTTPANFLRIRTGGRTASSGPGGKVFFIRPDKEIDVKALILREPAGVVYDVSLVAHWLAINGKQPTSPQNPSPEFLTKMFSLNNMFGSRKSDKQLLAIESDNLQSNNSNDQDKKRSTDLNKNNLDPIISNLNSHPRKVLAISVERRTHEISQEVMIYFRELTEACVGASESRRHEALDNATLDPGLQPILPHLMTFITEGVRINVTNHNLAILIYLMRLVKALIDNPHISLEPYLHLLVPTVITCVLNRQLCAKPITDNHWALRDFAAKQLVTLCNRHNTSSNELYSRVTRELSRALCSWIDGGSSNDSYLVKLPNTLSTVGSNSLRSNEKITNYKIGDEEKLIDLGDLNKHDGENSSNSTPSRIGPSLGGAVNSMNTLYGILVCLTEFGAQCLRVMVFPLLSALCHRLTALTETNDSTFTNNNSNNLNILDQISNSVSSLGTKTKLSPVDQRSFEFLKNMMANRLTSLLYDWRLRQGLGVTFDDYRIAYESIAQCLYISNQNTSTGFNSIGYNINNTTITTSASSSSNSGPSGCTSISSISNHYLQNNNNTYIHTSVSTPLTTVVNVTTIPGSTSASSTTGIGTTTTTTSVSNISSSSIITTTSTSNISNPINTNTSLAPELNSTYTISNYNHSTNNSNSLNTTNPIVTATSLCMDSSNVHTHMNTNTISNSLLTMDSTTDIHINPTTSITSTITSTTTTTTSSSTTSSSSVGIGSIVLTTDFNPVSQ